MTLTKRWRYTPRAIQDYTGLAADTKPTSNVTAQSTFLETDTGKRYRYNGTAWVQEASPLTPIEKANVHDTAKNADTVVLGTAIAPTYNYSLFRIMVAINSATVFNATITKGTNTQTVKFNSGSNLVANALYIFDMLVHTGDTLNFKCTGAVTYLVLRIQEIPAGVQ